MQDRKKLILIIISTILLLFGTLNIVNILRFHIFVTSQTPAYLIGAFTGLFLNLSLIISAIGIVKLKNWARVLAIILLSISSLYLCLISVITIKGLFAKQVLSPWLFVKLIEFVFYICILVYLAFSKVKKEFK